MTGSGQTAAESAGSGGGAGKRVAATAVAKRSPSQRQAAAASPESGRRNPRRPPELVVDLDLCKSCGICIKLCPHNVLSADAEGRPLATDLEACTRCRFCEQHCPDFALQLVEPQRSHESTTTVPPAEPGDDEGDG